MRRLSALVLMVIGLVVPLVGCSATATLPAPTVTVTVTETVTAPTPGTRSPQSAGPSRQTPASGLPTVAVAELPPEGQRTLELIAAGGPFPYSQDDQTFQNREGILPSRPYGFYREYTVETPGSPDRGARRLVAGSDGVVFYTDDHYNSFSEVIE